MIGRKDTLKLIKEKVDSRTSGRINLKKHVKCTIVEGVFKHDVSTKVCKLAKQGNSVMFIDDVYQIRNITMLDTKVLHQILWQILSDKEKMEITYTDFLERLKYLN